MFVEHKDVEIKVNGEIACKVFFPVSGGIMSRRKLIEQHQFNLLRALECGLVKAIFDPETYKLYKTREVIVERLLAEEMASNPPDPEDNKKEG